MSDEPSVPTRQMTTPLRKRPKTKNVEKSRAKSRTKTVPVDMEDSNNENYPQFQDQFRPGFESQAELAPKGESALQEASQDHEDMNREFMRSTSELQEIIVDNGDRLSSDKKEERLPDDSQSPWQDESKESLKSEPSETRGRATGVRRQPTLSEIVAVPVALEEPDKVSSEAQLKVYPDLSQEVTETEAEEKGSQNIDHAESVAFAVSLEEEISVTRDHNPEEDTHEVHEEIPEQPPAQRNPEPEGNVEVADLDESNELMPSPAKRNPEPEGNEEVADLVESDELIPPPTKRNPEPEGNVEVADLDESDELMPPPAKRNPEPEGNLEGADIDDSGEFSPPDSNDKPEERKTNEVDQVQHQEEKQVNHEKPVQKELEESSELPWAMYKGWNKKPLEAEDDNLPSSDEESHYAPPKNEDAPDLYEMMGSLDGGDTELNSKASPPSLFGTAQQQEMHRYVEELKLGLAEEEISEYLDEFEKQVEEEVLMIGSISLEEVQDEERRLREEHIAHQQQQAKQQRDRQEAIMLAMERAKKYVMQRFREKYKQIRMREEHLMQRDRLLQDRIHRSFRRSENQLLKALKKRKGEVKTMYGDLIFADGQYGGSKGRRWKVDWNRTPQPVQIKLKCLRGVKDKLPASRYVLMVSLYDRLGGHVMKWSNLKGQQWGGATLPLFHDGEFYNVELKIDQSVFTVCPSRPDMRPGMILVFELFILRGAVTPTDKVVGWACFPICDGNFNVIEGKYKTPLLRGDMDPAIDKFETIERLMASDLEHWLCNLYFEIIRLPRYMAGQKEYEVELQFSSGLVSFPVRTKTGEDFIDGEKPQYGSNPDFASPAVSRVSIGSSHSHLGSQYGLQGSTENTDTKAGTSGQSLAVEVPERKRRRSSVRVSSASSSRLQLQKASELSTDLRQRRGSHVSMAEQPHEDPIQRPFTVHGSRKVVEEQGLNLSDDDDAESSGTDFSDDDVYVIKKDGGFKPVKGQPGMYYKIHQNNPVDVYSRKMYTMLPKTPLLSQTRKKRKLTHFEELDQHSYAVKPTWTNKGSIPRRGREKMQYIGRMLLTELGLSQWRSREFWAMLLMLILTWWIRLYLHYVGQWVFLTASLIPINKFEFLPYTVNLNYQNTLLRTREEIAMIVLGPFTCIFVLILMVLFSWFFQALFDRFPDIFSRLIMAFGIQAALDPIWLIIVDSALLRFKQLGGDNPIGDAFKLYWHFSRYYNNDNVALFVSISMTVFLYTVSIFCTCSILYMYFLRLHNNGRMIDVYWRLHGDEDHFFLPYDLEISNEELNYVCRKAEQWRGEEGERRKIAIYDYVWEEEEIPEEDWDDPNARGQKTGTKEITTHCSVHTLHLDGLRELYRHFLRLPEGSIVEVFGEMNIPGIDEGVKQALQKGTNYQDNGGIRRKRSSSIASSYVSSVGKPPARTPSYFLDVPTVSQV